MWVASPGDPTPESEAAGRPALHDAFAGLGVESGPLSLAIGGEVVEVATSRILAALGAADAEALHAVNPEFAPFWCPRCRAAYCGEHWRTWLVFDEDDPTWFEEQRGICPEGHERMLVD